MSALPADQRSRIAVTPRPRNPTNPWQGRFRFGHVDAVAHRYALDVVGGVDGLALTHLDLAGPGLRICRRYDTVDRIVPGPPGDLDQQAALTARLLRARPVYDDPPVDWSATAEAELPAPVLLASHGPPPRCKEGPLANALCIGRGPSLHRANPRTGAR